MHALRAGVWKPRTRPGMFEGIGEIALPWLEHIQQKFKIPVCIEVANTQQVELALKYNMQMIWIGARTTVNPFNVQQIADALKGTSIPVAIKNPVNPDINLWQGAVERFEASGTKDILIVHRGFSVYDSTPYRNAPMWHIAIEMKRRNPSLIMLCDPSHICGRRDILLKTSQQAIDLSYDGLMIESHINPDMAWSDAAQQLTPTDLEALLHKIIWRKHYSENEPNFSELIALRKDIDLLDDELLQILSQRMKIADKIGQYKKENNIAIYQPERYNSTLLRSLTQQQILNLSPQFIHQLFNAIHYESVQHQTQILQNET
jgi:chorismate mutase